MERLTRRAFTRGALGGAAGLALGGPSRAAETIGRVKPSIVGGLQIGVQSFTYRKLSLDRMIESMRSVGLSSVELWTGHLDPARHDEADFKAARGKLDAAGITVNAYCVNFPTDVTAELLDKAFKGAGLLGTKLMTTSTEKSVVPRLDEWCRKYDVTIGLHNHWLGDSWFEGDPKQNFEGPADYAEAFQGRSPRIAINLDIGHFSAAGHDPVAFFREHHARIVSLHVKDRDKDKEHTYRRFGEGATPIVDVLKLARRLKYRYPANLEYEM
ncbi:MAG TPA: TIM barrel protein, partial [Vicinamibacteria bacterium]|nr:TIM barrel protein [Vicinamibacteria bacterium]